MQEPNAGAEISEPKNIWRQHIPGVLLSYRYIF